MNYRLFWARIPFMERLPQLLTPKQSVPSLPTLQYFNHFLLKNIITDNKTVCAIVADLTIFQIFQTFLKILKI